MRMKTRVVALAIGALMIAAVAARPAQADSFLTSVGTNSKTAARVAPKPYIGQTVSAKQARGVAGRALSTIRNTKNIAIGLDVIRRVDSVAMNHTKVGSQFRLGLAKLARSNDPKVQLLRGVNLVMRNPDSRRGISYVRKSAKKLPGNSAAQLAAGLAVAQRDSFGAKFGKWEKKTPLKREAARLFNKAQRLESSARYKRPLVREGLKQAKEYAGYYEGFKGLIK